MTTTTAVFTFWLLVINTHMMSKVICPCKLILFMTGKCVSSDVSKFKNVVNFYLFTSKKFQLWAVFGDDWGVDAAPERRPSPNPFSSEVENNKGMSPGKKKKKREVGKKSFELLTLLLSNRSRETESRPLRKQPVRGTVGEGSRDSTGCSFQKTHTTQLVSLADSFLLILLCRSQTHREKKGIVIPQSGCRCLERLKLMFLTVFATESQNAESCWNVG